MLSVLFYLLTFVDLGPIGIGCQRYVCHMYLHLEPESPHADAVHSCLLHWPSKLQLTPQSIYCIEAFFDRCARPLAC